jgi:hypothetical protein
MGRRPKRVEPSAITPSPEPATQRPRRRRGEARARRLEAHPTRGQGIGVEFGEGVLGEEDAFSLPGQQIARLVLETVAQMPPPGVGLRTIAGLLRGETRG